MQMTDQFSFVLSIIAEGMPFGGIGPSGRKPSLSLCTSKKKAKTSQQMACTPVDTPLTYSRTSVQLWIPRDGLFLLVFMLTELFIFSYFLGSTLFLNSDIPRTM